MQEIEQSDLVPVYVPKEHIAAVYKFLGDLDAGRVSEGGQPDGKGWTPELIELAISESDPNVINVLTYLAERPGVRVPGNELLKVVDYKGKAKKDFHVLAGVIGAFGRRVASRYGLRDGRDRAILPFDNPRDSAVGGRVYVMTPEIAEMVQQS